MIEYLEGREQSLVEQMKQAQEMKEKAERIIECTKGALMEISLAKKACDEAARTDSEG